MLSSFQSLDGIRILVCKFYKINKREGIQVLNDISSWKVADTNHRKNKHFSQN